MQIGQVISKKPPRSRGASLSLLQDKTKKGDREAEFLCLTSLISAPDITTSRNNSPRHELSSRYQIRRLK